MHYIVAFSLFDESILQFTPHRIPMVIIIEYLKIELFQFFSQSRTDSLCLLLLIDLLSDRHDGVVFHQLLAFLPQSPFHRDRFRSYGQFEFGSFCLWH